MNKIINYVFLELLFDIKTPSEMSNKNTRQHQPRSYDILLLKYNVEIYLYDKHKA
jgi:hypothetical protein